MAGKAEEFGDDDSRSCFRGYEATRIAGYCSNSSGLKGLVIGVNLRQFRLKLLVSSGEHQNYP